MISTTPIFQSIDMKSIQIILLLLSSVVIPEATYAQFFIGGSYSYLAPSFQEEQGDGNFESVVPGDSQQTNSVARYSYGRGHEASLKLGYQTKKNFLFGIDFSRLEGTESVRTLKFTVNTSTANTRANTFRISPYIQAVFPIDKANKLHLYTKLGGIIGLYHRSFNTNSQKDLNGTTLTERETSLTGGSSLGIMGGDWCTI